MIEELTKDNFQAVLNTLTVVKGKRKLTPRSCHVLVSQSDFRLRKVWLLCYAPIHEHTACHGPARHVMAILDLNHLGIGLIAITRYTVAL